MKKMMTEMQLNNINIEDDNHFRRVAQDASKALAVSTSMKRMSGMIYFLSEDRYLSAQFTPGAIINRDHPVKKIPKQSSRFLEDVLNHKKTLGIVPFSVETLQRFERMGLIRVLVGPLMDDPKYLPIAYGRTR